MIQLNHMNVVISWEIRSEIYHWATGCIYLTISPNVFGVTIGKLQALASKYFETKTRAVNEFESWWYEINFIMKPEPFIPECWKLNSSGQLCMMPSKEELEILNGNDS